MKICTRCNVSKDKNEFVKRKSSKDGYDSHCKQCSKELGKIYRDKTKLLIKPVISTKLCSCCRNIKDVNEFGPCNSRPDGLRCECNSCRNFKYKNRYKKDACFRAKQSARLAKIYLKNKNKILKNLIKLFKGK